MKKIRITLGCVAAMSAFALLAQNSSTPERRTNVTLPQSAQGIPAAPAKSSACMTPEEVRLVDAINNYRRSKGLPAVQPGVSLTRVAQLHAADLTQNQPARGACNMHSWSSNGNWTPCCYTSDHRQAACMWKKPAELTSYKSNGFEISAGSSGGRIDAATALRVWQGSSGHNAVIINAGMWRQPWGTFGVVIYGGYAVAWFGQQADSAGAAIPCK